MNTTAFLSYASSKSCKNDDALAIIRKHCSKESSIRREGEYHDNDDADLLPTLPRLRQAFPTPESHINIRDFLSCTCDLCKPQHGALEDERREQKLSHEILDSDKTLKAFTTLVLSGCLFAFREFLKSEDDLKTFTEFTGNPGSRLRQRLFRFASPGNVQCQHTEEARAATALPQQCLTCLGSIFQECIAWKFRLQTIRTLKGSDKIEEYVLSRTNLPIVLEHEDQIGKPSKPGVRFTRCRVEATHCSSEELKTHELFRKRYSLLQDHSGFEHERQTSTNTVEEKEASIALALGSLDHANIAKVLLVFREDAIDPHLSLLFRREQHNLEEYLQEYTPTGLLGGFTSREWEHTILLDHGLWRSLLGIVDAVASMHEIANGTKQTPRLGPPIFGHFDIKPANILVSESGTLLLTDFGQAASRTVGTSDYAPPEHQFSQRTELVANYDVWSMACILLQALIFIRSAAEHTEQDGKEAVHTFYSQRKNETEHNPSGAFWIQTNQFLSSSKDLRSAVMLELDLLSTRRHPKTKDVVKQLRLMLCIDPTQRPPIRECLKVFSSSGLGRDIFRMQGDIQVEPGLANWITSFTTEVQREPVPCRLQLYRTVQSGLRSPEVNLTLEYDEPSTHSRTDIRSVHEVTFVPKALFDFTSGRKFSQSSETNRDGDTMRCSFENLFRGLTVHFFNSASYLDFVTLMTYQRVLPDIREDHNTKAVSIRFRSCNVVERRQFHRNRELELNNGIVQVWELLTREAYCTRYQHVDSTLGHETLRRARPVTHELPAHLPTIRPHAQVSRYKMALFGVEKVTGLRSCLIVDVGTDSYTVESKASIRSLEFLEKSEAKFRSILYQARDPESYPGFPISPDVLATQIKDSGMRTSSINLELEQDPSHHKDLQRFIRKGPGPGIKQV